MLERMPVLVRRLMKLRSRVAQWYKEQWNNDLKRTVEMNVADLERRCREVGWIDLEDKAGDLKILDGIIEDLCEEARQVKIDKWRARMEQEDAAIKWVKEPGAQEQGTLGATLEAPETLEKASMVFKRLWKPEAEDIPDEEVLVRYLQDMGNTNIGNAFREWEVSAESMQKRAKKKKRSSAGPDGWKYGDIAKLPMGFFQELADLCNAIIGRGLELPDAWVQVRTVLLPKPGEDGARPISIAAAAWRLMGTALLGNMTGWIWSWAAKEICGGIPGREADDIHEEFQMDMERILDDHDMIGGKIDLSKAFDRVSPRMCIRVLEELGMCKEIGDLLRQFYDRIKV